MLALLSARPAFGHVFPVMRTDFFVESKQPLENLSFSKCHLFTMDDTQDFTYRCKHFLKLCIKFHEFRKKIAF